MSNDQLSTQSLASMIAQGAPCDCAQGMAVKIVETVLKVGTEVSEPEQVDMLFDFIAPLVSDAAGPYDGDDEVSPAPHLHALFEPHHPIVCISRGTCR